MVEKSWDILGIGVAAADFLSIVDTLPQEGEVVKSIASAMDCGGPVATALACASKLGATTSFIDNVGNDWTGNLILEKLTTRGVDSSLINISISSSSAKSSIWVSKSKKGERTIVFTPGSATELDDYPDINKIVECSKIVHINGRHLNLCKKVCALAKNKNTLISFDGGSFRYREELDEIISLADIIIVTKDFALKYSKELDINLAAKILLNDQAKVVVITDGTNGSWLFTSEIKGYHQPAFILEETIDTTGCGDSFHGAFLFGINMGYKLEYNMKFASAVAAINSKTLGGQTGLPDLNSVITFIEDNEGQSNK
ncbi:MAG: carbohydrate kinase family protein [Melioribacteraceae bacterium]|nr:carbohydrate kinase family protein [Melioribacteraceae bacterium]